MQHGPPETIIETMQGLRGRLRAHANLAKASWFQVGGEADILFRPEDVDDLSDFMRCKPDGVATTVLGVGSNLLIRDGGIEGIVIRLGKGFATCQAEGDRLTVGAGCLNSNAVAFAASRHIGGLEFLSGIPGSIGGALAMNAGAYGQETAGVLVEADAIDAEGNIHRLTPDRLGYGYRRSSLPEGWIFTRAVLRGARENPDVIEARIAAIAEARGTTQPVRARTGGSTFKNPPAMKAWQLIDVAGCRGLRVGAAEMSTLHCNFMINTGGATADDLEHLGETVRNKVFACSGVTLEWEIKRVGRAVRYNLERAVA